MPVPTITIIHENNYFNQLIDLKKLKFIAQLFVTILNWKNYYYDDVGRGFIFWFYYLFKLVSIKNHRQSS